MDDRDLVKATVAEFFGPFTLVMAGVGAIISTQNLADGGNLVAVAFAHGLAIAVMVAALGHISGGHFNPAVSIAMLATGQIGGTRAGAYVVAQLLGGVAAAGVLAFAFPALGTLGRNNPGVNLGVLALGPDITVASGVILELVMTFFLVLVIFGTAVDARGSKAVAPLAIGLTITIDILFGGRLTGAGMNPARAFGPAVVQQDFTNWWIYWIGPIVGGIIAAVLYKYFWLDDQESATVPVRRAVADVEPIAAPPETRRPSSQSRRGRRR